VDLRYLQNNELVFKLSDYNAYRTHRILKIINAGDEGLNRVRRWRMVKEDELRFSGRRAVIIRFAKTRRRIRMSLAI
jgi:hypothetical protein